jgi:hypothetical protein
MIVFTTGGFSTAESDKQSRAYDWCQWQAQPLQQSAIPPAIRSKNLPPFLLPLAYRCCHVCCQLMTYRLLFFNITK